MAKKATTLPNMALHGSAHHRPCRESIRGRRRQHHETSLSIAYATSICGTSSHTGACARAAAVAITTTDARAWPTASIYGTSPPTGVCARSAPVTAFVCAWCTMGEGKWANTATDLVEWEERGGDSCLPKKLDSEVFVSSLSELHHEVAAINITELYHKSITDIFT